MILQRITKSILTQDWFTVAIEILIVVVGILLGLQVNNWNEHRKSLAWEQRFLSDLATEFQSNREQLRQVVKLQETRRAALRDVLTLIETEQGDQLLTKVQACYTHAMFSNLTFFPTKGAYLSALSTGSIDEVRNTGLRYAVMDIYERAYPRLVYNGEIYDERSDKVSWDVRENFDPYGNSKMTLEFVSSPGFRANVRFLFEQSRHYMGLARDTLVSIDTVVMQLPDSPIAVEKQAHSARPAKEAELPACWQRSN